MSFAELYHRIDESNKTNEKLAALVEYFAEATDEDASWAVFFLTGRRLPQPVPNKVLRSWATHEADIPEWLFEETYAWVGDLAETMSCILPPAVMLESRTQALNEWAEQIRSLRNLDESRQRASLTQLFSTTPPSDRFPMMKLLTGAMRVGVSQGLIVRALAKHSGLAAEVVTHRLMGDWEPTAESYRRLLDPDTIDSLTSRPYPFALANPLDEEIEKLGSIDDFQVEWKWDGIRSQLIRREGNTFLWSRGEERLDAKYPEIEAASLGLPCDCVLDGEILAWRDEQPLPFAELQRRIGRKTVGKKLLQDVPVCFIAFDVLEVKGADWRSRTQRERREKLTEIIRRDVPHPPADTLRRKDERAPEEIRLSLNRDSLRLSPLIEASTWADLNRIRDTSREMKAEGLMLKRIDSPYQVGRVRGHWWKWKLEPYTIDAVLIYAQRGHGRRAALYTDFTFALWDNAELVPFAKAYSGLSDQELTEVDRFVRANTREKFGPVRSVRPQLVMELAFENIQLSNRHKSGLAVRFPRIVRWRHDKKIEDADHLEDLKRMVPK